MLRATFVVLFAAIWIFLFLSAYAPVRPAILIDAPTPAASYVSTSAAAEVFIHPSATETHLVTRVIDGDTIELQGGMRVRYIGIDTPESVDPRKSVECFGAEAKKKNEELVLGKRVRLEKDIGNTDRYGRLLRYVYADSVFVNLELVKAGFAHSYTYPPDVKYQDQFIAAEKEAREAGSGLWSACGAK